MSSLADLLLTHALRPAIPSSLGMTVRDGKLTVGPRDLATDTLLRSLGLTNADPNDPNTSALLSALAPLFARTQRGGAADYSWMLGDQANNQAY